MSDLLKFIEQLAEKEGIKLDKITPFEFFYYLDDWIDKRLLRLPYFHPLRTGDIAFGEAAEQNTELSVRDMILLAEEANKKQDESVSYDDFVRIIQNVKEDDDIPKGLIGDNIRSLKEEEDGEDPRDTPLPEIYGEEIDASQCRKVVVVPGILGSQILENYKRPGKSDLIKKIWPPLDVDPSSLSPLDNLIERPSPNAPKREAKILNAAYSGLINRLEAAGFKESLGNLHLWGYDWTKSNKKNGQKLKDYINDIAGISTSNPNGDCIVDVIAHSMGGIVTRTAIKLGAKVRKTVYVASPHYGTPRAYAAIHPKANDSLGIGWWANNIATSLWNSYAAAVQPRVSNLESYLSGLGRKMPSAYELLPDAYYFEKNRSFVSIVGSSNLAQALVGLARTYYDRRTHVAFPTRGGLRAKVIEAMIFKSWLGRTPPGEHLSIYSNDLETPDHVIFKIPTSPDAPIEFSVVFKKVEDSGQAGDGTVVTTSANVGKKILKNGGEHVALPNRQDCFDKIDHYLRLTRVA